jgi:hypothetical protein
MYDALGDALMVEVEDLLTEVEVFENGRSPRADLQGILVVRHRSALRGGQHRDVALGNLMQLAAFASN